MGNIKDRLKDINIIDWTIGGIILLFCFFAYQHADILHTGGSSIAYLNGHIFDFYEYNQEKIGGNSYMPTTYIIFAIWNIPVRVLGLITDSTMAAPVFVRMWYKLLTCLFYFGTTYLIYKVCKNFQVSKKEALLVAFIFVTNPIGIYSEFIFGQYDIITTFFMTLGLYYFLKNEMWKFVFSFSVAITCKYFALLIFVPLLLIKEKNIIQIIKKILGVVSLFAIEVLVYIASPAFRKGVFGFGAVNYIFDLKLDGGHIKISLVVLVWILVCGIAYFIEIEKEKEFRWVIYLTNIIMFIAFGMSFWHPQWLLMAVPFWTLGTVISKKADIFLILDLILMVFYTLFVVNTWPGGLDQNLFSGSVISSQVNLSLLNKNMTMADLLIVKNGYLLFSSFSAILLVYTIFKYPTLACEDGHTVLTKCKGIIRIRTFGILFFILPSLICLYINYTKPTMVYTTGNALELVTAMPDQYVYEQVMSPQVKEITGVNIFFATYGRKNNCDLRIELIDIETQEVTISINKSAEDLKDCQYNKFDFGKKINGQKKYLLRTWCNGVSPGLENAIALYKTDKAADENSYAHVDGNRQEFNFAIQFMGK